MNGMVSIIVPIFNAEKHLSKCIQSILEQTYKNIQLILINDGSTDSSLIICNHYKSIDNRIIVIDKKNEGVSATRNHGIRLAEGDYIGFVDSDDYIEETMYETLIKCIKEDKSEVAVLTSYTINNPRKYDDIYKENVISEDQALNHLFELSFPTSLWAYLYRADIIEGSYLNEDIHFFEDFEFNFKILRKCKRISLCHDKLYNYIINEGSANSQKINDKRITCLDIYDNIITGTNHGISTQLKKRSSYFRAHFLIGVILSLSKDYKYAEEKYYRIVYKNAKKMTKDILFSSYVPVKYKMTILMCTLNTKLTAKLIHMLRYSTKI